MKNRFDQDTALTPKGEGLYEVEINRGWWIVRGPNGGYVAAILAKAAPLIVFVYTGVFSTVGAVVGTLVSAPSAKRS
jgi:hypothetical protein